ncbi:DUF5071 domain-containing protein [Ruegeria sp. HKCCD7255]|uniref:DUF5071 domain-containing protein n=1 Tax=Ruegeria sp. HKCCD7255 TaxID=2683004 RepID=UPI0014883B58|nr:DUF5071 domain-containing protein [Ruegeria sp. HKCCD7255]
MSILLCIPEDKHDLSAVERAKEIGFPSLNEALPELLTWVQDANWPVAKPIASILRQAGPEIVPHIRNILSGYDAVWKYWIIVLVIAHTTPEVFEQLRDELLRLANDPDNKDKVERMDIVALEALIQSPNMGTSGTSASGID